MSTILENVIGGGYTLTPDPLGVNRHSGHRHFEVELVAGGIIHPSHPNSLAELYAQISNAVNTTGKGAQLLWQTWGRPLVVP